MSIDTLKQSVKAERSAGAPVGEAQLVEIPKFEKLLTLWKDEVSRALPNHLQKNMDRFLRIALTEFRVNPDLALCDPRSVFAAVLTGAQMGWEIGGPLGMAYLVPYKGECQLIPGWKGYVDLVHRSGKGEVWTGAVYDGDEFEYVLGARPDLRHVPTGEDDPEKLTHTYSIGWIKDQSHPIVEVWAQTKLERHRKRYNKVGPAHYSFNNWEMYSRKVALLQCVKYLPASVEMGNALSLDYVYDSGEKQGLSIKDVTKVSEGLVFPAGNGGDKAATVTETKPSEPEPKVETKVVAQEPEPKEEDKKAKGKEAPRETKPAAKAESTAEKVSEKPSAPPSSPKEKNASEAVVEPKKDDDVPEWAKVPPKQEIKEEKPVEKPVEKKVAEAAKETPATVEVVENAERKRSKFKDILGIPMPEFITRLSNEPAPTTSQLKRAYEEMALINGPTGEATAENTAKQWMDVEIQELTQEAMEAFISVLGKYRESLKG